MRYSIIFLYYATTWPFLCMLGEASCTRSAFQQTRSGCRPCIFASSIPLYPFLSIPYSSSLFLYPFDSTHPYALPQSFTHSVISRPGLAGLSNFCLLSCPLIHSFLLYPPFLCDFPFIRSAHSSSSPCSVQIILFGSNYAHARTF